MSTKAAQSSTHVKDALNSVRELGMSYNDSGRLKCLYLKGGVSECEWVKVSSFNEMVVMGISSSGTRVEYQFRKLYLNGFSLVGKFNAPSSIV